MHMSTSVLGFVAVAEAFTPTSVLARAPASATQLRAASSLPEGKHTFNVGILGDLHIDPRDLDDTMQCREHFKTVLDGKENTFVVSLGDLGESKDCLEVKQLYSGTTPCFEFVKDYLDGFGHPFDITGGNHDLEGIDEFPTDEANMEAYLRIMGKDTPQFCHEVAPKTLLVGLGSSVFRGAQYTSHEVFVDRNQVAWFEDLVEKHPFEDGWAIFVFSHAPIIGSGLRVLQENHVVNGCCWLNHNGGPGADPDRFINIIRKSPQIKFWASGHFHLSHNYEDSITFPGGNNRGSCVFAQTGVHRTKSTRDGHRQSRFIRGNEHGFEICTINHAKGGELRLDATVTYSDECDTETGMCSTLVFAHDHEDYDHDLWFSAYTPQEADGCYIANPDGTLNPTGSAFENLSNADTVCWWHMKDGKVIGAHSGMLIEYDPSTLAPLGMVVSRDELEGRRVAVIDDGYGGSTLVLYDDDTEDVTVIQPNEDGSYWRKVVRNKMHRMREQRRVAAAKKWMSDMRPEKEPNVLSSYGPYTSTAGQVIGISTKALNSKVPK